MIRRGVLAVLGLVRVTAVELFMALVMLSGLLAHSILALVTRGASFLRNGGTVLREHRPPIQHPSAEEDMRAIPLCIAALLALGLPRSAVAQVSCTNDIDCPGSACGGMVCQWGATGHYCVPAGTDPQGQDGWCTATTDCKCASSGATCAGVHCTFTTPPQVGGADLAAPPPDLAAPSDLGLVHDLATARDAATGPPDLAATVPPTTPAGYSSQRGCSTAGARPADAIPVDVTLIFTYALLVARARRKYHRTRNI